MTQEQVSHHASRCLAARAASGSGPFGSPGEVTPCPFPAGCTHALYPYQLRQWFTWCESNGLDPLVGIQRAHVELQIRRLSDELGLRPAPGLANLRELVEQFRADGLQVALEVKEPLPVLPAGVDVSAYRIVQEALTNAVRYGADSTAALRVSCTATALSIRASNPSNGSGGLGSGLGLTGIAERFSLLGGSLSHGVGGDGAGRA